MSAAGTLAAAPIEAGPRTRTALVGWLGAQAVSLTGTRLSMIAIPWFVLTTTGSASRTGLVAFAEMTPYVAAKALGGPLIDRIGARRVSVACDLGSVVAVGSIPLLSGLGRLPLWALLLAVALAGGLRGPGDGAKEALVPRVAAAAGATLERVTGLAGAIERLAGMSGAAAGGLLIAAFGAQIALRLDAASFAVAAGLIAATAPGRPPRTVRRVDEPPADAADAASVEAALVESGDATSYLAQLRAGWTFLRADQVLMAVTVMVALTNLLDQGYFAVLLPVWAHDDGGGSAAIGVLLAVFAGASALGSAIAAAAGHRLPRHLTYLVAFILAGAPRFVALGLGLPLPGLGAVAALGGFASGFLNPILGAVIFERIPPELYGRVHSLSSALCWALMPLGGLLAGLAIGGIGLPSTLIVCGAGYFTVTMLPALLPRWREIDRRPAAACGPAINRPDSS